DLTNLNAHNMFWQISNDGNLLPNPVNVESVRLGVAERADVIIDFAPLAGKTLYLENRLEQTDGRGPTGNVLPAGQGNSVLQIVVDLPTVPDNSVNPATNPTFYALPSTAGTPTVTRTFKFERGNGQWQINGQFMDCNQVRFKVQQNTIEHWILQNSSGGWQHPIHIHFEEFQTLLINGSPPSNSPLVQTGRKDVIRLEHNTEVELFFRFRDFLGRYPMHCHNVIHEDHAMMLRFDIATKGDTNKNPWLTPRPRHFSESRGPQGETQERRRQTMKSINRRSLITMPGIAGATGGLPALASTQDSKLDRTSSREMIRARYFPNVALTTHEGRKVRFYDDLIKDKIVTINFMYADCEGVCPGITANLVKVQRALGERVGRDIFMYSFTLKPEHDSPDVLKEYAEMHRAKPGW